MRHEMVNDYTLFNINSVSLKENNYPVRTETGGYLRLHNSENNLNDGVFLVGEKDDDTHFKYKDYAFLDIQEDTKFTVGTGSTLKIQKDGRLDNTGILVLENNSTLISPTIDCGERSRDFTRDRKLKRGINNENGVIKINKGSKVHNDNNQKATFCKGTVDLSDFFSDLNGPFPPKENLIITLEGMKIKLFDPTDNRITDEILDRIKSFKRIDIGDGCELDYDFKYSDVYKLPNDEMVKVNNTNYKLLKDTVVRSKGGDKNSVSPTAIQRLFENNGSKLNVKQPPQKNSDEYSLHDLLDQFNKKGETTILNTSYQCLVKNNKKFDQQLTKDWSQTIHLNKFHLCKDQFTKSKNEKMNDYDMHFTLDGKKEISFMLKDVKKDQDNDRMNLYGDLSNFTPLINKELVDKNGTSSKDVINNFVQKYSGLSPYLRTNNKTHYKVAIDESSKKRDATLRFYKDLSNDNKASLKKIVIGTDKNNSIVDIDISEDNSTGDRKYAQHIVLDNFTMKNRASKFTVQSGQILELGLNTSNKKITQADFLADESDYSDEED